MFYSYTAAIGAPPAVELLLNAFNGRAEMCVPGSRGEVAGAGWEAEVCVQRASAWGHWPLTHRLLPPHRRYVTNQYIVGETSYSWLPFAGNTQPGLCMWEVRRRAPREKGGAGPSYTPAAPAARRVHGLPAPRRQRPVLQRQRSRLHGRPSAAALGCVQQGSGRARTQRTHTGQRWHPHVDCCRTPWKPHSHNPHNPHSRAAHRELRD